MEKKYQVFVSSTFIDLKEERKEIIEMLLNSRFIPAGMEMFTASNEEQFKYIKKIIDNCDYYILILGGRYGSVNVKSGKSFTEMEYEYALENNIPVLAFVHSDPDNIIADKREQDNPILFKKFRNRVLDNNKMCKMWTQKSDLIGSIATSLMQIPEVCPRQGWVRGGPDSADLLSQIVRLKNEKEKLQGELDTLIQEKKACDKFDINPDNLADGEDLYEITGYTYIHERIYNPEYGEYFDKQIQDKMYTMKVSWDELFFVIAQNAYEMCSGYHFRQEINALIEEKLGVDHFQISDSCYNTIKFQFMFLELVELSGGVEGELIELTHNGKSKYLKRLIVVKNG